MPTSGARWAARPSGSRSRRTSFRRSSARGRRTRTARPCCWSSSPAKRSPSLTGARSEEADREPSMRFGWLTLAHSGSPEADYGAIQDLVAQACFAETAGFDGIWLTEHNFTGESVYCDPIPFASVVAARTSRIRIGFAVIQLALRHPIRLATQLALLDNLSDGRLDVGVGHGTNYNEYEFVGYGLRSQDSRERMEETLDVLVRAWTEAPLVHHGKFYDLSLPALRPRPRQRPHPPIWRAVSSAGSVRECGRIGAPILIARIPIARVPERLALYDAGLAESGLDGAAQQQLREKAAVWRFVHLAESQSRAEDGVRGFRCRCAPVTRLRAHASRPRGPAPPTRHRRRISRRSCPAGERA